MAAFIRFSWSDMAKRSTIAGIRDSALTNHGVQQTTRLGEHLTQQKYLFTSIFSSDLARAFKTAEAIRDAQAISDNGETPSIVQSVDLREQDFGYYEGKPFFVKKKDSSMSAKQEHFEAHKHEPGFDPMETKEAMMSRADRFLITHLLPILSSSSITNQTVAVVSHGMLLSALWKSILKHQPPRSVTIQPEVLAARPLVSLEHLGGWSNTGYLELHLQTISQHDAGGASTSAVPEGVAPSLDLKPLEEFMDSTGLLRFSIKVMAVNSVRHLQGLKRTRGGVGSSRYDEGQRSIDSFFKKRKFE
ncbi:MAG: hypothetical protein M1828_005607 [Chrysothrix sp. TS-e1954]|nr:MAG: hypothetical protein M1828_005607 [Chrysothrix sp. TS-e1954]